MHKSKSIHLHCLPLLSSKKLQPHLTHDRSGKRCAEARDISIEAGRRRHPKRFDLAHPHGDCVKLVLKPATAEMMRARPTMAVRARKRMWAFSGVGLMAV
jgi:hypothetical protein